MSERVCGLVRVPWRHFWREPGCQITPVSDKLRGAEAKDEVVNRVHGVLPPPMGMERGNTCE